MIEFQTEQRDGGAVVLRSTGRLDMVAAPRLRALVAETGAAGAERVVVDLRIYEPAADGAGDDLAESGRGLEMARALSDELAYEREGAVNRWLVVRRCTS